MCIVLVGVVCIVVVVCGTCVRMHVYHVPLGRGRAEQWLQEGTPHSGCVRHLCVDNMCHWGGGGGGCGRDVCNPGPFDRQQGPIHKRGYGPRFLIPPPPMSPLTPLELKGGELSVGKLSAALSLLPPRLTALCLSFALSLSLPLSDMSKLMADTD